MRSWTNISPHEGDSYIEESEDESKLRETLEEQSF